MPQIAVEIKNLDRLLAALKKYPAISRPQLAKGINASLLEIQKNATDANFQFKTPRSRRTGMLQLSFKDGFEYATDTKLEGSIGPTARSKGGAYYPLFVHEGTGRMSPNPFMERIADASTVKINGYIIESLEKILAQVASNIG